MTEDGTTEAASELPYDAWTDDAMRMVGIRALEHVAREGLPGKHHFYLSFRTDRDGVVIPPRLRAKHPREMTIVLQHQFWDLKVDRVVEQFSVGLSFGGVPSILVIPFGAMTGFSDPHAQFEQRFVVEEHVAAALKPASEPEPEAPPPPPGEAEVVSLDKFRRRKD